MKFAEYCLLTGVLLGTGRVISENMGQTTSVSLSLSLYKCLSEWIVEEMSELASWLISQIDGESLNEWLKYKISEWPTEWLRLTGWLTDLHYIADGPLHHNCDTASNIIQVDYQYSTLIVNTAVYWHYFYNWLVTSLTLEINKHWKLGKWTCVTHTFCVMATGLFLQ